MAVAKIDLTIFKMVFKAITESDTLDAMASQLTQLLVGGLGIKGATIFILDPDMEQLEILATFGLSVQYINKGPVLVDKSIKLPSNREPVVIRDVSKSDRLQYPDKAKEEGIQAIISIPIRVHNKIIGALRLYHSDVWDVSEQDIDYLHVLSQDIGISMMYYRLANAMKMIKETVNEVHDIWLGK